MNSVEFEAFLAMLNVLTDFVWKVENGKARSVKTYTAAKAALLKADEVLLWAEKGKSQWTPK